MKLFVASLLLLATGVSSFSSSNTLAARASVALFAERQDAFAAFADSLEEPVEEEESWQERLEELLDPTTSLAQRQVLLSELLNANEDIRDSVSAALRDRKIDPLLTPTGRKLQDGTRAVARQLTTDILPSLAQKPPPLPDLQAVPKIGSRILNAISNQAKKNLENLQQDIQDPLNRIPQRFMENTQELQKEAANVFLETPQGLQGPSYTLVEKKEGYEIRDYEGYSVASTTMSKVGEPYNMNDVSSSGAAFNALAAYLFGANEDSRSMEMTTPVTTTSMGEMRFYLSSGKIPEPLQDGSSMYEAGAVQIVDIPPARLAVRRFTGFVTEGEVTRQKDTLLTKLEMDGVEIDVPHGAVVPHVIFQYNPPYTIPMVRRNEIAVPVVVESFDDENLETKWKDVVEDDLTPSDVDSH